MVSALMHDDVWSYRVYQKYYSLFSAMLELFFKLYYRVWMPGITFTYFYESTLFRYKHRYKQGLRLFFYLTEPYSSLLAQVDIIELIVNIYKS